MFGVRPLSKRLKVLGYVVIALVMSAIGGCLPWYYTAPPLQGLVIDAETGEPLAGVVVLAIWLTRIEGLGNGNANRLVDIQEAETGLDGRYAIGGGGPWIRRPFTRMTGRAPGLMFVRRGYLSVSVANRSEKTPSRQVSDWNQETISLSPNRDAQKACAIVGGALAMIHSYDPEKSLPLLKEELQAVLSFAGGKDDRQKGRIGRLEASIERALP